MIKKGIDITRIKVLQFREGLAKWLVQKSVDLDVTILAVLGWRIGMQYNNKVGGNRWSRRKLLVLTKTAGNEDIEAAYEGNSPDYGVYFLPRELLKIPAKHFLQRKANDLNYLEKSDELHDEMEVYRTYLFKVLKVFRLLFGLDTVLQFNYLYYAERELIPAATKLGIRLITANKENLLSKSAWSKMEDRIRKTLGKFEGWKISVYSEFAKEALVNISSAERWQIEVTGCARMDYSHLLRIKKQKNGKQNKKPVVLYYMIHPRAGLPELFLTKDSKVGNWYGLIERVNNQIINLAKKYPDIEFIAKAKVGATKETTMRLNNEYPKNFKVIKGGVGHYLLEKADVVVGFNSTALFEAIAGGIPVVVPALFSEDEQAISACSLELEDAVFIAKNGSDFENFIVESCKERKHYLHLTDGQKKVLDMFMNNSDGMASERLRKFIDDAMYVKPVEVIEKLK